MFEQPALGDVRREQGLVADAVEHDGEAVVLHALHRTVTPLAMPDASRRRRSPTASSGAGTPRPAEQLSQLPHGGSNASPK